jgi:hypothetical protein
MVNHPIGNLMILLVLAGCGSMQRWGQDELQSASVAHNEAARYANMVDDCDAPEIVKSQDAIVRMEAIMLRNQESRPTNHYAIPPVTEHEARETFETTYPWMFDSKFMLADRLRAEGCEVKARVIYQQIADTYPGAVFAKYRDRAASALSGPPN